MAQDKENIEEQLDDYKSKVSEDMRGIITYDKDLVFVGRTQRGETIDFDGKVEWGCMPTESLLLSVGACMAIDVVSFLKKMRAEIEDFRIDMSAKRNTEPPQYFKSIHLDIKIKGKNLVENKVQRAIDLSKDKYCSVYHTLRPDLVHTVEYTLEKTD